MTVYLTAEMTAAVAAVCASRRVHKSTLVRTAIERLLLELERGQLALPLGIVEK